MPCTWNSKSVDFAWACLCDPHFTDHLLFKWYQHIKVCINCSTCIVFIQPMQLACLCTCMLMMYKPYSENIYSTCVPHGHGKMHALKVANPATHAFVVVDFATLSFPSCQNLHMHSPEYNRNCHLRLPLGAGRTSLEQQVVFETRVAMPKSMLSFSWKSKWKPFSEHP